MPTCDGNWPDEPKGRGYVQYTGTEFWLPPGLDGGRRRRLLCHAVVIALILIASVALWLGLARH